MVEVIVHNLMIYVPKDAALKPLQEYQKRGSMVLILLKERQGERAWAVEDPELTLLGRIPMHRAISRGIDAGHPFMQAVPNTPEASAFLHIATQVSHMFRT
jgi:hypothetical protein